MSSNEKPPRKGKGSRKIGDLGKDVLHGVLNELQTNPSKRQSKPLSTTGSAQADAPQSNVIGMPLSATGLGMTSNGIDTNQSLVAQSTQAALATQSEGALDLLLRLSKEWRASEAPVLSIDQCKASLVILDASTTPCDPKVAMILLEETLELFGAPENWHLVAKFYLEAIEDIPEDLLMIALKSVRTNNKWFPKPVEIREAAMNELSARRYATTKLKVMLRYHRHSRARLKPKEDS